MRIIVKLPQIIPLLAYVLTHDPEYNENTQSAQNFTLTTDNEQSSGNDVLVIERNLKGIDYKLSKCCAPIFGDEIFGFVTINGGISIHRKDCSNAQELRERYPYRIIEARWSDTIGNKGLYQVTLRIVGHDDIGIVNNITSLITQEKDVMMRGINIESHDTLFSGTLTLMVSENSKLNKLMSKIENIKGVKQVRRV